MSSLIERIAREAEATFSMEVTDPGFETSFNRLVRSVGELRASDVNLEESIMSATPFSRRQSACFYIDVFSSGTFLISICILNPGFNIPLHDQPGTHGIVKVIKGSVKISTYTAVADDNENIPVPQDVRGRVDRSQRNSAVYLPVTKHVPMSVGVNDQPCVLRPQELDFHEISAVGFQAAFLNVLSPPFDMVKTVYTFYRDYETAEQDAAVRNWLVQTRPDNHFFTSALPYRGPEINLNV